MDDWSLDSRNNLQFLAVKQVLIQALRHTYIARNYAYCYDDGPRLMHKQRRLRKCSSEMTNKVHLSF